MTMNRMLEVQNLQRCQVTTKCSLFDVLASIPM